MSNWTQAEADRVNAKNSHKEPKASLTVQTQGQRGKTGGKGKKVAKAKGISESQLQQSFFKWFRSQYPDKYWQCFAIPNGGLRNKIVAARLKKEGAVSGVWDVLIALPSAKYMNRSGLWIEFKVGYNKLTDNQKEFRAANEKHYDFAVCYTLEAAIKATNEYLKPIY